MSTLYLITLGAVAVAILGALLEAVLSVSRPKDWPARRPLLMVVESLDRRSRSLPIVGRDRRSEAATSVAEPEQRISA